MKTLNLVRKQDSTGSALEKRGEAKIYSPNGPYLVNVAVQLDAMRRLPDEKKPTELELVLFSMHFNEALKKEDPDQLMSALEDLHTLIRHNPRLQKISEALAQVTEGFEFLSQVNQIALKI